MIIVSIVIFIFLWQVPSAIIPYLPFIAIVGFLHPGMRKPSNIMSLSEIKLPLGRWLDAAIVVVEQTHKKLEE